MRARSLHAFYLFLFFHFRFSCCFLLQFLFSLFHFCFTFLLVTPMLSIYRDFLCTTYVYVCIYYGHSSHIIYLACIFICLTNLKCSQIQCFDFHLSKYIIYAHVCRKPLLLIVITRFVVGSITYLLVNFFSSYR